MPSIPSTWRLGHGRHLRLDTPRLIGIVNATPDSFSDGGDHPTPADLVRHARALLDAGATVIDVGGESTRPGARAVSAVEQIDRTCPVIEAIARDDDVIVSIDTTRAEVAHAAVAVGAHVINDVSAGRDDPEILDVAAGTHSGIILMHRLQRPEDDRYSDRYDTPPAYDDVVDAVRRFLDERTAAAVAAGIDLASVVVDPGLGFGKTVEQNYELIRRTSEIMTLGRPVLSAASRKSFIGRATGVDVPRDRVAGSVAVSVVHFYAGVRLFRVHDVEAHRHGLAVAAAIESGCGTPLGIAEDKEERSGG